jgi:hypothetical protein
MAAGERAPARRLRASAVVISTLMTSILGLAVFGTLCGFFLSNYFLSNYTQHHGILDSGTISNVSNTRSDRGSWSATVQITLDRPVDGATSTTLTVGNEVNSPDGTPVTVLVDPQDPAHAEYPGQPIYPLQVAVIFLSFTTGVFALLFIFAVRRLAVIRFRNRGLPPAPRGPPPVPARHAPVAASAAYPRSPPPPIPPKRAWPSARPGLRLVGLRLIFFGAGSACCGQA